MAIITPSRQRERRETSTRALLQAASELVLEGGYSAMTFAAIGERAGYSRAMVTARFGSKQGLVEAMLDRIVGTWRDRELDDPLDHTGFEVVTLLADALRRQAEADARSMRVLYALMFEAATGDELLRDHFRAFHAAMRESMSSAIARGQQDGSVDPALDPTAEGAFVVSAVRGIGYQWLLDPDGFDAPAAFEHLHHLFIDRFRA
ncbi:MAG: TetR/AcrR family transcriptional regulator [Actinomycetota bacterium]